MFMVSNFPENLEQSNLIRFETNVSGQFFYLDPPFLSTSEKVHVPTGTRARILGILHVLWNSLVFRVFW